MNAVVSLAVGRAAGALSEVSAPVMRDYAARIGCRWELISKAADPTKHAKFEKAQLASLLHRYQRIIYFDCDILLNPRCPDLFKLVPAGAFGAYFDSNGGNGDADLGDNIRAEEITAAKAAYGPIKWDKDYFNSGVMVFEGRHADVFRNLHLAERIGRFVDQTIINYRVQSQRHIWYDIGQKFNHFAALGRSRRMWETRFDAHVIHYAGFSEFYPERELLKIMAADRQSWCAA